MMVGSLIEKYRLKQEERTEILLQQLIKQGVDPLVVQILAEEYLVDFQEYNGEILLHPLYEGRPNYSEFKELATLMIDEEITFTHETQEFILEDNAFLELARKLLEE
ncbi:hypothetical protein [Methanobacterium ferruginis]|uniref:hypothetical protein n=1 Tax=Methanobacterium ferruginis TaxID=710191 RepID=UPI002572695B|nr:hypothetical protein [Methanobacterium ferruginis]BDZ68565.1 hypothetical protein GCM10025860_20130 [Methanobacterium ferruginis]